MKKKLIAALMLLFCCCVPIYAAQESLEGRWEGERGEVEHDHGWDKHRERDFSHEGKKKKDKD